TRGHGDGVTERQHEDDRRARQAHRHGRGPALRHPRRRPHRRLRPGRQDRQLVSSPAPTTPREAAGVPKSEKRVKVTLACEECKRRNYITIKSRVNDRDRIEMKKYCRWDKRHTLHQETR